MTELAWLIVGLLIGGCIGVTLMCCLQLNRVNDYESEIRKLKEQLKKENR
jgi:hypothetical protein